MEAATMGEDANPDDLFEILGREKSQFENTRRLLTDEDAQWLVSAVLERFAAASKGLAAEKRRQSGGEAVSGKGSWENMELPWLELTQELSTLADQYHR